MIIIVIVIIIFNERVLTQVLEANTAAVDHRATIVFQADPET